MTLAHKRALRRSCLWGLVVLVGLGACGGEETTDSSAIDAGAVTPPVATPTIELFSTDLEQVCAGGTVAGVPEYDESAQGIHPMLAFEGKDPEYSEMVVDFPEGWVAAFPDIEKTELVACLNRTGESFVKTCKGYESDETDETFSVDLYNADYEVTLYAARSGDEVATTRINATAKDCPMFAFFDEGEQSQIEYASPDKFLRQFVQKYVAP